MLNPRTVASAGVPSEFSASYDAVQFGLALLNKVEDFEGKEEVEGKNKRMESSPPMYPNDAAAQQPKMHQLTNMTNATPTTTTHSPNNNSSTTNNNNNNGSSNNNGMNPTPLRVKTFPEHTEHARELAELATQEISLDLQGLIDDTHFPDDNLFGDLIETAKKNDGGMYGMPMARGATPSSGSSGQNSPGSEGQNSPPAYNPYARNALAYLPGSVHNGATFAQMGNVPPQHQGHHQGMPQVKTDVLNMDNLNIILFQVKQEPVEQDFSNSCSQAPTSTTNTPFNNYNNGVSSSTPHPSDQMGPILPFNMGGPLPSLKSFASAPKYLNNPKKKNGSDKTGDDYRRRRERNNVAVRKSREKAKMRTRETEDRVKILARENERLQKKVELLQEELSVLRSLFSSVGVLPEHIHRELAKHLDNFQAQHAANNY